MDAADDLPAVGCKLRSVLRHAGCCFFLHLVDMHDQIPLRHMAAGMHIYLIDGSSGSGGNLRHTGGIHDQSHAVRLYGEGSEDRPDHNGNQHHSQRDQSHPADGRGDGKRMIQFLRGAHLVQSFLAEYLLAVSLPTVLYSVRALILL